MEYQKRLNEISQIQKLNNYLETLNTNNYEKISKISCLKYVKNDMDIVSAKNRITKKLEMYEDQRNNFKYMFKALSNDDDAKSAISINDTSIANICVKDNVPTNLDYIKTHQIVEIIDNLNARLYIDIDFHNESDIPEFNKALELVKYVHTINNQIKSYSLIEYKPQFESQANDLKNCLTDALILENSRDDFEKGLSCHIYFNIVFTREELIKYTAYLAYKFDLIKSSVYDCSVYKMNHQTLRCSFSDKIIDNAKTGSRDISKCRKIPETLFTHPDFKLSLIKQLRAAPMKDDLIFNECVNVDILDVELETYAKAQPQQTQKYYPQQTQSKQSKQVYIPEQKKEPSIFTHIKVNDEIKSIDDLMESQPDNFTLSNPFLPYAYGILSEEEFIYEMSLLAYQLPQKVGNTTYTEEDNKAFIESVISHIQYTHTPNLKSLYSLKKYNYELLEIEENQKDKEEKDKNKDKLKLIHKILNKIMFYIEKYEKEAFIHHEFYDIKNDYTQNQTKAKKIRYNIYLTVNDDLIYYPYLDRKFETKDKFKKYFGLNSKTFNDIYESLVIFESYKEFNLLHRPILFDKLPKDKQDKIKSDVMEFLEIFKKSFKYESDYKFYLSWYSAKLNKKGTIYKGIINQGTEKAGAKDSLKTMMNDLLHDYLNIISGDVNNLNKTLNGGYFMGDITCIEELPQHIKDIDNLVNVIKQYTSKEYLTLELKGANPVEKLNESDIVINTNHTVRPIFKNKNDCEALLKRFKILTRVSLDMSNARLNELIDLFKQSEDKNMYRYMLYKIIKDDITPEYFNAHKKDLATIEQLYNEISTEEHSNNRISTTDDLKTWTEYFKTNYIDTKGRLKLSQFKNLLKSEEVYKNMSDSTFKGLLITLLLEDNTDENLGVKLSKSDGKIVFSKKAQPKVFEILYNQFYEYNVAEDVKTSIDEILI